MRTRRCWSMLAACFALLVVAAAGPSSAAKRSLADQAEDLKKKIVFTPQELGPDFVQADYGRDNPVCWNMKNAPTKPRRRLAPLVQPGMAGPNTHLCYIEYVRAGTHDDILIKIYIFQSAEEASATLHHRYLKKTSKKLEKHGLPPVRTHKNFVYFVTASESNTGKANEISEALEMKLDRVE